MPEKISISQDQILTTLTWNDSCETNKYEAQCFLCKIERNRVENHT